MSEAEANTPYAIGDKSNPIVDKKYKLLAQLDDEFYYLLDEAYNHLAGFKKISSDDLSLSEAFIVATRYLVLNLMQEFGSARI